jgi:hypothetical protein
MNKPTLLCIVRCGDNSLHPTWSSGAKAFDVAVSYFGKDETLTFPEARYVHRYKGGKWDGLYDFFRTFPDTLSQYAYYWFPDDDISATADDILSLLDTAHTYGLDLCQPSLNEQSYYSHLVTLKHLSFRLRYTNFVEIMVPLLSQRLLAKALPTFEATRSGFGLDFVWPKLASLFENNNTQNTAIIDAVSVHHTRPVGGVLNTFIKNSGGLHPMDEMSEALKEADISKTQHINRNGLPHIQILSGIGVDGSPLSSAPLAFHIMIDLLFRNQNRRRRIKLMRVLKLAFRR